MKTIPSLAGEWRRRRLGSMAGCRVLCRACRLARRVPLPVGFGVVISCPLCRRVRHVCVRSKP